MAPTLFCCCVGVEAREVEGEGFCWGAGLAPWGGGARHAVLGTNQ